jgi:nuclear transport factor 2 (NTF2) superfamily protein
MTTTKKFPLPPWDMENAAEKLQIIENTWNTLDAFQVTELFSEDADVRFGTGFLKGRSEIESFLKQFWAERPDFKLRLDLWGALKGRMAVRFEYDYQDDKGQSIHSYGVEVFQFDEHGYIEMNYASYNDLII